MRETCRVRSRSTSAARAVHVRVRAIARRISADRGTPAAFALARQSADSVADTRAVTTAVRRSGITPHRHGGRGAEPPSATSTGARRAGGSKGGRRPPLASPIV